MLGAQLGPREPRGAAGPREAAQDAAGAGGVRCASGCPYVTDNRRAPATRRRMRTGEKPFPCAVSLGPHRKIHAGERTYERPTCLKVFASLETVRRHRAAHVGEKPLRCDACGRAYAVLGNLERREATHADERPYVCTVCDEAFAHAQGPARPPEGSPL
uniref:Zinc finger protein 525-like n=1 Tax=Petromyzon marinus TaxID=7757 RepID=A0AAJ7XIE4_PETMA|nr:zinc finger protein 525-like [Petromyzon marinus]